VLGVESAVLRCRPHSVNNHQGDVIHTFIDSVIIALQIASASSENHGKNNGGPNQWIIKGQDHSMVVKDPPLPSR